METRRIYAVMKTLIIVMVLLPGLSQGQKKVFTVNGMSIDSINTHYIRLTTMESGNPFSGNRTATVMIDFGQVKGNYKNMVIKDDKGKVVLFTGFVEALNFFDSAGWDLAGYSSYNSSSTYDMSTTFVALLKRSY